MKSTEMPCRARSRKRLDREVHHFGGGGRAVAADQLRAELQTLARRIELVARDDRHRARIAQPQRARRGGEARRRDPAHLHGDVRPQRQRAQRRGIGEAEHPPGRDAAHPALTHSRRHRRLELDQRRDDPVVTVGIHRVERRPPRPRERTRGRGQAVFEANGQQIGGRIGHAGATSALRTRAP